MTRKAVFLDRDGTLVVDPDDLRINSIAEIELFPQTLLALHKLAALDYYVIIITNQAGIGEGLISVPEFWTIQNEVIRRLEPSGVKIRKTYMCPHLPEANCACRKPKPKLLLDAAKDFGLNLSQSWFIGDRQSDILTGIAAGTKTILVETGNVPVVSADATHTAPNLLKAIEYIAAH